MSTFRNLSSEGKESIKTNLITFTCLDCDFVSHFSYKGPTLFDNKLQTYIINSQHHADQRGHRITNFMSVQWVYTGAGLPFGPT